MVSSHAQLLSKDGFVFLLLAYLDMGYERAQAGTCTEILSILDWFEGIHF